MTSVMQHAGSFIGFSSLAIAQLYIIQSSEFSISYRGIVSKFQLFSMSRSSLFGTV